MRANAGESFRVTAITQAAIAYGVAVLPDGARKRHLTECVRAYFAPIAGLILPFTDQDATAYGDIMAARRAAGRPMSSLDAQIAAIALSADGAVATRNTRDFEDCGVRLVNPYDP